MTLFEPKQSLKCRVIIWYPNGEMIPKDACRILKNGNEYTIETPYDGHFITPPEGSRIFIDVEENN